MKAIVYSEYGGPNVLRIEDVALPTCASNEILIQVKAAEATKADCEMRSFRFSVLWFWLPLRLYLGLTVPKQPILGCYFSGKVIEIGPEAKTKLSVGDEVYGSSGLRLGGYGEYLALPDTATLVRKPQNMTFPEAAAVPLGGLNALHFMQLANIQQGDRVLIIGAGGSIGAHAVQIAKLMGAYVAAVDKTEKEAFVCQQGADRFIDYTVEDILRSDEQFDVIFDMVPGSDYAKCLARLTESGRYLLGNARLSSIVRAVATNKVAGRKMVRVKFAAEKKEELDQLSSMIEAGNLNPIVEHVFPMQEVGKAHEMVESETRNGAIVLEIS
ncbi:MAG: NAD(P)-dependent alcohol dehydrogenase [Pseudomonadota bacterium]